MAPSAATPAAPYFRIDAPKHILYFEDSPRHLGGETIADTRASKLMHETGHLPVSYFPQEDARTDLLEPTAHSTHCPFKGDASYWTVRAGDREAQNAVWGYPDPLEEAPPIAGYMAFRFDAMDDWLERTSRSSCTPATRTTGWMSAANRSLGRAVSARISPPASTRTWSEP